MINDGRKVLGVRCHKNEKRFDIGNFHSYFKAFTEYALADPDYGAELKELLIKLLK